jgi:hypothetical protein
MGFSRKYTQVQKQTKSAVGIDSLHTGWFHICAYWINLERKNVNSFSRNPILKLVFAAGLV